MLKDLEQIEILISQLTTKKVTDLVLEKESVEYLGCNFKLDNLQIKFRQAKVTPKKVGLFVTLWQRNSENKTEPFNINDPFDFYIVAAKQDTNFGFFFFSKNVLSEQNILSNSKKEGKRGFRVYPDWTKTENNQAAKSKVWQTNYFINLNDNALVINENLKRLMNIL